MRTAEGAEDAAPLLPARHRRESLQCANREVANAPAMATEERDISSVTTHQEGLPGFHFVEETGKGAAGFRCGDAALAPSAV